MHMFNIKVGKKVKLIIVVLLVLLALLALVYYFVIYSGKDDSKNLKPTENNGAITVQPTPIINEVTHPTTTPKPTPTQQATIKPTTASSWPVQISMADASSITVVVNKKHQLPSTYVPENLVSIGSGKLRSEARDALQNLFNAANANGNPISLLSGYRSFNSQKSIYNNYVAQYGQAKADTFSARPGHSEHQTGLAADVGNGVCNFEICFGNTEAGKWLSQNAQMYGYIIRYPSGKDSITGYQYEPWHLRYVGVETAKNVFSSSLTLDQYFGIPAGGYE